MFRWVEIEARLDHPVEPVFSYLEDPTRWPEFAPAVVRRVPHGDGAARVGERWSATDRIGPFRFSFVDELLVHERNRRVVWGSSSPWNARVEYDCRPAGRGTHVRARYEGDLAGWLRLLGAVPPWVMGRILGRDFVRLNRLLTG